MAKTHDRTRTAEAKQETNRRKDLRRSRSLETATNNRAIKLLARGL